MTGAPRVAWLAVAAVAAGVLVTTSIAQSQLRDLTAAHWIRSGAGHAPARVLDVRPRWTGPGRPVSAALVGLSVEWPVLAHDLGSTGTPPPGLVDALRLLGRPPLRIGGNSQDRMWPTARAAPTGAVWTPPAGFWPAFGLLAREAGGPVQVGLDLAHGDPQAAIPIARAAAGALPPGSVSFSLGNEPDRYGVQRWARLADRRVITARAPSWSFADYLRQYATIRHRLGAVGSLAGPDFADARWRKDFAPFLARTHPQTATVHAYPLNVCGKKPHSHAWPTERALLARSSWAGEIRHVVAWAVADAARAHTPLVVSEANSVACGGARGVSNGAASALWAPAFLLSAAQAGAGQVDLHASGSVYDPFHVVRGSNGTAEVQPTALFDGLTFVRQALGPDPQLVAAATAPAGRPAWALRGSDGRLRVLVENLDAHRAIVARIHLPQAGGWARVVRMTRAGRDVTGRQRMAIDGQTRVSVNGRLVAVGRRTPAWAAVVRGTVRVALPPWSAAVVVTSGPSGA
jgi:hypothetical protein